MNFDSFELPTNFLSSVAGDEAADGLFRVLFVCTANICRSAYADVMARHLMADLLDGRGTPLRFASAGTWGFDQHPMCPEMVDQAEARGVDASWFRSQRVTRELIADAHLVLAAGTDHVSFLVDEWPAEYKKVFTFNQFAAAIADAAPQLTGRELLAHAQANRRPANRRGDLPDPYRRGSVAAAESAELIDAYLELILQDLV